MNLPGPQIGEGSPFRLTIPPDLAKVTEVRRWLGRIAEEASLPGDRTFDMLVAVSEAVANGVEHAASAVEIEVWLLPDRLIIEVSNDGDFKPGRSIGESLRRRGLGLPLMVSLADDVHAIREPGGRTRFSLTFLRGPRQDWEATPTAGAETAASGSAATAAFGSVVASAAADPGPAGPTVAGPATATPAAAGTAAAATPTAAFEPAFGPASALRRLETERLKATEAASRADLLADLLEHVTQPFGVGLPDGTIVMFNSAYAELLGYTREEFAALDWTRELTPPEWWDYEAEKLGELAAGGGPVRYQKEYLHKDGTVVPADLLVEAMRDASGEPAYFYAFITDLSDRARAEAALRESEERFRVVADFTRDWEHWRDQEGHFVYMSPSAERVTGYDRDEFLADPDLYLRIVHPDDQERVSEHLNGADIADSLVFRIVRRDGEERWIEHACEPVTDSAGRLLGRRGSNRDITERLLTQERLQLEEQKAAAGYARSLIEASLDPLVTISPEGKITDVNEATVKITGRTRSELIGTDFSDYFTDPESARRGYQEVFAKGSVIDYPLTLCDREGALTDVLYNASVYNDPQGNVLGVFAAARDVSWLKELEDQRRIASTLQQTLLDLPSAIPGVTFGHLYRSATAQAAVGGDFFDVFEAKKGRVGLLIGDVAGHGVEAARMATLVKDSIHAFAHQFRRPSVIVRETNELLLEKRIPGFVTIFLGMLDPDTGLLTYSLAGHPYPLWRHAGGEVEELTGAAVPLGVFPDQSWKEYRMQLHRDDLLLLYTDGASEARRDGRFFGEAGLIETLRRCGGGAPEALPQIVLDDILRFSGGILTDDVALLAVSLRPSGDRDHAPETRRPGVRRDLGDPSTPGFTSSLQA